LTDELVKITGQSDLKRILDALLTAERRSPNHPAGGWLCLLTIDDGFETVGATLHNTTDGENGLVVMVVGNGWNLGQFRCNALAAVLEDIIDSKRDSVPPP